MSSRSKRGGRGSRGGCGGRGGRGPPVATNIEVELPARMKTREANKDAHPGQADVPKSRRSAAEMELARAAEAEQNAVEERQQLASLRKVAEMEDQLQQEDSIRSQEAYTGPPTVLKLSREPRRADVDEPEGPAAEEASAPGDGDVVMADAFVESSEVGSDQSDDNSKSEHHGKDSNGEAEEGVKGKKKHKQVTRDDVLAQRQTTDKAPVRISVEDKSQKRKSAKKSKQSLSKPGGLDAKAVNATKDTTSHTVKKPDDDSLVRVGGFAEDDEDVSHERDGAISRPKGAREAVKINTPETTILVKQESAPTRTTKKEDRGGKPKWTLSHLPSAYRADFGRYVVPLIRAKQGTRPPWAPLKPEDLQEVLDAVAPGQVATMGGAWYDMSQYRCQDSRTNLGKYAIRQVHALFEAAPFSGDTDKIKDYVEDVMVVVGTGKNATSPFLWRHWGKTGKHKKGFLQTDLIIATFSLHLFETIRALPSYNAMAMCTDPPVGALILAGQAVEHALRSYKTGIFVDPAKTPSTHFSATNYGDYIEISSGSKKSRSVKRATRYVTRLGEWPEETWADILARARAYVCEDQGAEPASAATAASEDEEDDGDFDLKSASGESDSDSDDGMGVELGE